jgi:hypothetical protein
MNFLHDLYTRNVNDHDGWTHAFCDDVDYAREGHQNGRGFENEESARIRLDCRVGCVEVDWLDRRSMGVN